MATQLVGDSSKLRTVNGNRNLPKSFDETDLDETDLAATRRPIPNNERVENKKVHWFWDLVALGSVLTFVADIGSDLFVAALYFSKGEYVWFGLTLGFVFLSSFTLQVFSAKWFYEDANGEHWLTYILHVLHLGPIARYLRAFRSGYRTRRSNVDPSEYHYYLAEWRDICMLRLFEAYLESAPQLVLQLYILAHHRRFNTSSDLLTAITASCSLVSLAWAIVAYTNSLRDVMKNKISWTGFFFQILWRLFMLASRITALVLFASFFDIWLFVAMGVHWLCMFLSLVVQYSSFCVDNNGNQHPCREVFYNAIIAFVYNFSFFNITEGATRLRLALFYTLMLAESTVAVVLWYPHRLLFGDVLIAAITLVFGGFMFGLLFMIIYYQFYHPNIEEKGFCFKRGVQLNVQDEQPYTYTNIWCCCCEVRATCIKSKGNAIPQEPSAIQRQLPLTFSRNANLISKTNENRYEAHPVYLDMEILPRHLSHEQIPRLLSPVEASYYNNHGRVEVTMNSSGPAPVNRQAPSQWI